MELERWWSQQTILADLEWETDEKVGIERESDEEEFEADEEFREIEGVPDQNGRNTSHGQNSPREGRARKPPVWMRDYESGQGLSDEEIAYMTHLVFFTDEDPVTFEEAVKFEKWRQAID